MKISKKILPLFLASTLATNSFASCETNLSPKHIKHFAVGAYSILSICSAKLLFKTIGNTIDLVLEQERAHSGRFKNLNEKTSYFVFMHTLNASAFALFSYLTCFFAKNAIQELLKKNKQQEKKKKEKRKSKKAYTDLT